MGERTLFSIAIAPAAPLPYTAPEQENLRTMKPILIAALAPALDAPPPAAPPTAQDVRDLADRLREATEQIAKLEERLAAVEKKRSAPIDSPGGDWYGLRVSLTGAPVVKLADT